VGYSAPYSHHTPAMVSVKWCRNALPFPQRDVRRRHEQEKFEHARIDTDFPGARLAQHKPRALTMLAGLGVELGRLVEFGTDVSGIHGRKL
jgi:hypothetical protein